VPRFVILEHDHPQLHWDLMLEVGESLKTWRLAAPPGPGAGKIAATAIGDHRRAYLDYEGPVSGGRGTVRRWDLGSFEILSEPEEAGRRWVVRLEGQHFRGKVALERVPSGEWELVY
jgi:hypothetical protein